MLRCFPNHQHTNNADPWEGGRRLADLSHRGEVSEAAKELHRAECNVLATIFWKWAVKFQTYICQRDNRVLVGSIEVLMPGYQKKSGSWYLRHIDPNVRNIYLSYPVPINWLGVEWGKTHLLVGGTIRKFLAWIYPQWPHIKPQLAWTSYQTSAQTGQDRMKIWSSSSFFFATPGKMHPRTLLAHKCRHCRCPIVFFVCDEYVACHHRSTLYYNHVNQWGSRYRIHSFG